MTQTNKSQPIQAHVKLPDMINYEIKVRESPAEIEEYEIETTGEIRRHVDDDHLVYFKHVTQILRSQIEREGETDDLVYLKNNHVVHIDHGIDPDDDTLGGIEVDSVLEGKSGFALEHEIDVGDVLDLRNL